MKLKKLEIYGFKSFLDRTEIVFDDGITAIVGPNGCGKSNISDAVRWVLGEQSAKSLRGSVMQDIIFNGTEAKKSLSYCEVSLFFDNTDKSLPLEYDEVVITRKLYRSGESEYYLNKNLCRLKDITDLMRIGQVGREGYSIIGQGRVEQFINQRPEDRREIFDEATGIAACKQKKVESERKLIRTRDNLSRYKDIISEIERQLEPMREQAVKAKKFLEYRDKLKYQEVNNFIYRSEAVNSEKNRLNEKIKGLNDELSLKKDCGAALEAEYQKALNDIAEADEHITSLRDKQLELIIAREKAESSNDLSMQRVELLAEQNNKAEEEIAEFNQKSAAAKKLIKSISEELDGKNGYYGACVTRISELNEDLSEINVRLSKASAALVVRKAQEEQAEKEKTELNNTLISLNKSKEYVVNSIAEMDKELSSGDGILLELNKKIKEQSELKESLSDELVSKKDILSAINSKIVDNQFAVSNVGIEITETEKKKAGVISQGNFLRKMKDGLEGFSSSVKRLLTDAKTNRDLNNRIEGVVANLMSVPKNYEIAVEAALGNAIQNIVTNDLDDTKYLISYLKERKYGIITFLPIPFVKQRVLTRENEGCLGMNGVLGVASKLISYDKKYSSVFASLLGATVIVDNIDNAILVARRYNSAFKIVTLEGEILSTGGSVSGGTYKPQISNYLSYDREIAECDNAVNKFNDVLNLLNVKKTKLILAGQQHQADLKTMETAIKGLEIRIATVSENVSILKSNTSTNKSAAEIKEEKYNALKAELSDIEKRISDINATINDSYSGEFDEDELKELNFEFEDLSNKNKKINESLVSEKITEVQLSSAITNLNASKKSAETDYENCLKEIEKRKNAIIDNNYIIEKCKEGIVDVDSVSKTEIDKISLELKNIDEYKKERNDRMKALDGERSASIAEVQKLELKVNNLAFDRDRIDSDLEVLRQKLADEYGLDYDSALYLKDDNFKLSSSNSEIRKLKDAIYTLGSVNVNAIEELSGLSERYDSMTKQKEDMEKAETDLNKVISDLTSEMRDKFDEGFKQINEYFASTFKELFGGGNARLKLVDNDNGDKLSYGVDIEAEPPGKTLQNINLLSGGEKALTSIAIIISIMKLRPMPFCIFDEIESALDEVNTVRFAKYIKNFSGATQFILVTHKKSTMETADRMFGVTMQEKGVSKVISVRLSDVNNMKGVV